MGGPEVLRRQPLRQLACSSAAPRKLLGVCRISPHAITVEASQADPDTTGLPELAVTCLVAGARLSRLPPVSATVVVDTAPASVPPVADASSGRLGTTGSGCDCWDTDVGLPSLAANVAGCKALDMIRCGALGSTTMTLGVHVSC